ncbi:hypothetical protein KC333_g6742 [Hortaea werneckii]|nr:hypothetical protein KC333_g6742 [Hortaea werneckii]KAI7310533.1 hypothetical protein KC326_g6645 [Hortaea werneckii]
MAEATSTGWPQRVIMDSMIKLASAASLSDEKKLDQLLNCTFALALATAPEEPIDHYVKWTVLDSLKRVLERANTDGSTLLNHPRLAQSVTVHAIGLTMNMLHEFDPVQNSPLPQRLLVAVQVQQLLTIGGEVCTLIFSLIDKLEGKGISKAAANDEAKLKILSMMVDLRQ